MMFADDIRICSKVGSRLRQSQRDGGKHKRERERQSVNRNKMERNGCGTVRLQSVDLVKVDEFK